MRHSLESVFCRWRRKERRLNVLSTGGTRRCSRLTMIWKPKLINNHVFTVKSSPALSASVPQKLRVWFGSSPDLSSAVKERNRCRRLLIIIIYMNLNQQINSPLWLWGSISPVAAGKRKKRKSRKWCLEEERSRCRQLGYKQTLLLLE